MSEEEWEYPKKRRVREGVGRPRKRGVKAGSLGAKIGGIKRRKEHIPEFIPLSEDAVSMFAPAFEREPETTPKIPETEVFDKGDQCKLQYNKDGSIIIGKGCEGKEINGMEISMLDRVQTEIDKKLK